MPSRPRSQAQDPDEAARAARAEWRSRQLLDAAARLMERDGFHGVSMQALAEEASVSVGLIYRYFGGKDDLLLAVIVDVLEAFATRVPSAVEEAGNDPVERIAAAFRAYCDVIDEHRHAAVLTYRESRTLGSEGRNKIKSMEIDTSEPLRAAIRDGASSGLLIAVDTELVAHDLLLMAHGWALKHWYLEQTLRFDDYVTKQTALVLNAIVEPQHRPHYRHLLATH
ncbi:TetR family transcriptional regulator [Halopolyspora algeriensis]|uniref:TetR family transcriptional regulator n=1 Tax=Halopolyspora algeriensis TaxID=1500506 RepID=A0A368VXY2_9ACTN|nr:TetR/AcrR family transcriptional regulator [Halopolyspora algeriensis]RCW45702.1 TetR family transcriptional regulator [Halopolyspora algeriensis]TQM54086.1 TetR family transcriptional regulator [Halopolyspora algeriensis]